uniref:malate dehydrogenase n=1 Tax=Blastobotrys adeninivorans TaxID=409370 RepID=A0A060T884_BLAAD
MVKAVVAGASGGIGQPLSLLLKLSPYVTELSLYDVVNSPGVAADLSHISSTGPVKGFLPKDDGLKNALTGAKIVVIPAGIPRKPGMTRDDLFKINAGIVRDLIEGVAQYCPDAFVLIISNPVNSTVPIAAEVLKKHNAFNPKKLFGVTTLDVVRAQTFVAEIVGESDPAKFKVPVIGGHSGETIVPLLSLTEPKVSIPSDKVAGLVNRIQFGGDEVVKAKDGAGSATLSMAYAGYRFAEAVLRGAAGEKNVIEPSFVYLDGVDGGSAVKETVGVDFFSVPVEFGPSGAEKVHNILPSVSDAEKGLIKTAVSGLQGNISKGVDFIANPPPANNVSCDADVARYIEVDSDVSVKLLPPAALPVSSTIRDLFASAGKSPVALIFYDAVDSQAEQFLSEISLSIASQYPNALVAVSNHVESNPYLFSQIEDESAYLAKQFRILHPLGGGRAAINSLVFVDSHLRQRGLVPIHSVSPDSVVPIIDHTLKYLWWEEHR